MAGSTSNLKIASYNSTGLGIDKMDYIQHTLNQHNIDIMMLQETWLLTENPSKLGTLHKDYLYCGLSGMDNNELLRGRPYGGLAFLWNKNVVSCVKRVKSTVSKRLLAITVKICSMDILIINCYMPCDNQSKNHVQEDFLNVCDEIEQLLVTFRDHSVIVGGDINIDTSRNNAHDMYYLELLNRSDLYHCWNLFVANCDYTYMDYANNVSSCIDHFAVSADVKLTVQSVDVIVEASNTSNHRPITLDLKINATRSETVNYVSNNEKTVRNSIAWHKVSGDDQCVKMYQQNINSKLRSMTRPDVYLCQEINCKNKEHFQQLDRWCDDMVNLCLQSDSVLPQKGTMKKVMPGWTEHVKPYRENNTFWFNIWKSCGKPRNGHVFNYMKEARRLYMYAIRKIKRRQQYIRNERLASAMAENRSRDFFAEIKRMRPSLKITNGINGLNDPHEIAELFAKKYHKLYNSVPSSPRYIAAVEQYINQSLEHSQPDGASVQYEMVKKAIQQLKHEKSDGDKGFISSHLIYASDNFHREVAKLLSSVILHGHHPQALVAATIISIPKDYKEDLSADDNYRGIALSNSLSKLLDLVILFRNCEKLQTSPLQFAFKQNMSTTMCTLVMKEVIKYYIDNKSSVYSCSIDASKAFDKIRHDKLFMVLVERQLPVFDLRILFHQYQSQILRTAWQGVHSSSFAATNGIRQGSIASPVLFCIYLDILLDRLHKSGIGCWIGNKFCGSLTYADDVTLLSPTATGLQEMLQVCESFGSEYGMSFNAKKTVCILYSRNKMLPKPTVTLCGDTLQWMNYIKHLGNYISHDLNEKTEIMKKKCDMIGRVNVITANLSGAPPNVRTKVFQTQCTFYGAQAWCLNDPNVKQFYTMYNRCIRRLMKLPYATHTRFLEGITGLKNFKSFLKLMYFKLNKKRGIK